MNSNTKRGTFKVKLIKPLTQINNKPQWQFQGHFNWIRKIPLLIAGTITLILSIIGVFSLFQITQKLFTISFYELLINWIAVAIILCLWFIPDIAILSDYQLSITEENFGRNVIVASTFFLGILAFSWNQVLYWNEYNSSLATLWSVLPLLFVFLIATTLSILTVLFAFGSIFIEYLKKDKDPTTLWLENIKEREWWE
ncbi:MAG: hypothetical protein ACFE89_13130 [Candidatus Hodarchaeota archaeon]